MFGLLALIDVASYPVLVHRLTVALLASSPRLVTLTQLRFTSLAVVSSREDFHLQDRAHAGRTKKRTPEGTLVFLARTACSQHIVFNEAYRLRIAIIRAHHQL